MPSEAQLAAVAAQASTAAALASDAEAPATAAAVASLYPSPEIEIDGATGRVILQYRDEVTGNPEYQVPSAAQLVAPAAPTSTAAALAPDTGLPTTAAPSASLYPSPEIEIDGATGRAILQYRDEVTGTPQYQAPAAAQVAFYQQTQDEATASLPPVSPHGLLSET